MSQVDATCGDNDDRSSETIDDDVSSAEEQQQWSVVRIFVSSTFRDFYSEREVLVKQVLPAILSK